MTKWTLVSYGCRENPGCYDNGNGAIAYIDENAAYPSIERVTTVPYASNRGGKSVYYRLAEGVAGAFVRRGYRAYDTAREAFESTARRVLQV